MRGVGSGSECEGALLQRASCVRVLDVRSLSCRLTDARSSVRRFSQGGHWVVPLHSTVASDDQKRAFVVPPLGVRKACLHTTPELPPLLLSPLRPRSHTLALSLCSSLLAIG